MSLCVFVCPESPLLSGTIALTGLKGAISLLPTFLAQWCGVGLSDIGMQWWDW